MNASEKYWLELEHQVHTWGPGRHKCGYLPISELLFSEHRLLSYPCSLLRHVYIHPWVCSGSLKFLVVGKQIGTCNSTSLQTSQSRRLDSCWIVTPCLSSYNTKIMLFLPQNRGLNFNAEQILVCWWFLTVTLIAALGQKIKAGGVHNCYRKKI